MSISASATAPIIVQSDGTILLDERLPRFEEARDLLRSLAELRKCPGSLHTYRMTPVTLWNAAAAGWTVDEVLTQMRAYARYGIPAALEQEIKRQLGRYGRLRLQRQGESLLLASEDVALLAEIRAMKALAGWLLPTGDETTVGIKPEARGWIKRELVARGYPIRDEAGYRSGEALSLQWRDQDAEGRTLALRDYQLAAIQAFHGGGHAAAGQGGSGVVVLPCGAGKTWVGIGVIAQLCCETLILTPNAVSVSQWIRELRRGTTLEASEIGAYRGGVKQVRPVTVATYQMLTHRQPGQVENPHWQLFQDRNWGLIIYDEVHLLPAPVFRLTADLQATRRLGLTATLVREDGLEGDVFALVGPKLYDAPWKSLEEKGWIAEASCQELRVPLEGDTRSRYDSSAIRARSRIAGENPAKTEVVRSLLRQHEGEPTLIIGQYLDQLRHMASDLQLPLITGQTPHPERERLYDRFNRGELRALVLSKAANFAVDLPDASVAIQISGSFGSRQEEAQRLGRILRPKSSGTGASFYSLVSEETDEVEYARKRQQFLLEQGYRYSVGKWRSSPVAASESDLR